MGLAHKNRRPDLNNYKILINYDGTRYYGWEHQPDRDTIQGKIEAVLGRMCGESVEVIGAGRTDAGVHAKGMCANFHAQTDMDCTQIRDYLNRYLPEDIAVTDVRIASEQFHARYKAVGKTYRYTCFCGEIKPVFDRKYVNVLDFVPDIDAMKEAAAYMMGEHDYKSFCGNPKMKKSTVRIVDSITIEKKRGYIYMTYHGTGFLQNMVRIMTGTLLEVGRGKYPPDRVKDIMEAKQRSGAGPIAPACGLCLTEVEY